MNEQSEMQIIANDLENMAIRIEALRAHPKLTDAGTAVAQVHSLVREAMADIHRQDTQERLGGR